MPRGIPFTGEFKQKVVEDVIKNKLSYGEAMRKYGIAGKMAIQHWEQIYLEEGPEGLYVRRRSQARSAVGRRIIRPLKPSLKADENLIAEVERLRAEVDYLKKLNALVSERVQREKKHKL